MLIADATQRQTLEAANVHSASAVAVLTSDDLTNIETALAVRDYLGERWLTVPVVLRVFDRALGHTVEHHFDFRHVRSTSALAAPPVSSGPRWASTSSAPSPWAASRFWWAG